MVHSKNDKISKQTITKMKKIAAMKNSDKNKKVEKKSQK